VQERLARENASRAPYEIVVLRRKAPPGRLSCGSSVGAATDTVLRKRWQVRLDRSGHVATVQRIGAVEPPRWKRRVGGTRRPRARVRVSFSRRRIRIYIDAGGGRRLFGSMPNATVSVKGAHVRLSIARKSALVTARGRPGVRKLACEADTLVVHLLPSDAQQLAELFGGETGDEVDKFARCAWRPGPGGAPVLEECGNWFAGRILERLPAGDHDAFLLEPFAAATADEEQFDFHRAKRIEPGHEA
jgi:hypothetical protein